MNLTKEAAELIGMHVGDGTLYRTKSSIVWELRGDLQEKAYYFNAVVPLLDALFHVSLVPKFRSGGKHGCFGVQTTHKEITSFFCHHGFQPGRKSHTVRVPDPIMSSPAESQRAFLRGYFDTDGCLRFQRINKELVKRYPTLEMGSASSALIQDVSLMLRNLGFHFYSWFDKRTSTSKICLAGEGLLSKWMNEISPHNPKHLNKYLGFCALQNKLSASAEVA